MLCALPIQVVSCDNKRGKIYSIEHKLQPWSKKVFAAHIHIRMIWYVLWVRNVTPVDTSLPVAKTIQISVTTVHINEYSEPQITDNYRLISTEKCTIQHIFYSPGINIMN